jgi:DNA-directed RNA polymerase subunit RPC12/RpoP
MPVRFRCPYCSRTLSTASRKAGSFISCPVCRNAILVEPLEEVVRPDFSMFELDPLPELELKPAKKPAPLTPRVFVADRLHTAKPAARGLGVRVFAWFAAVLLLVAIGAFLYFGFGPKA